MTDGPSGSDLKAELEGLRARLAEAEEALRAIRNAEVDAVVVAGKHGEQVYTLRGADRIYRQLIETMGDGAVTLSADGVILYCNVRMAEMLGRPLDQVLGTALRDYLPPADQQVLGAILAQAGTSPGHREINLKTRDGGLVPVYLSASRPPSEEAGLVFCLVLTDLTGQKSQEQIVAAERLARLILEQAAEAIVVCDGQGRVIRASDAARRFCDGSPLGRPFAEAFPLRTDASTLLDLSPVLKGETLRNVDVSLEGRGQILDLNLSAGPLLSGQQAPGCVVTLTDISKRKRAEAILAERERTSRLMAELGGLWNRSEALPAILNRCAEALVVNLDAAFARIWTLNREENVLELQASAGMYTHLDGPHGRVKVGEFKIGLIAEARKPHLTNCVIGDPQVSDQEWARREGMVSFAGYPLMAEGQLLGVMAMFARHPLSESTLDTLAAAAEKIAIGVERKLAEEARDHRAAELQESQRIARIGNWEWTIATGVVTWSEGLNQILARDRGLPAPPFETVSRFYTPESWKRLNTVIARAIETGESYDLEVEMIRADGGTCWTTTRGEAVRGAEGAVVKLRGTVHDITERRRVEEELRASRQILEGILNAIPVRVFWKDKNLLYLGCNTEFARDAGFAGPGDIIGKDDFQMGWREQAELYRGDDRQVIDSGCPKFLIEEPLTTPDGKILTLLTSKVPLRGPNGEVVGVLGTYLDISGRKRAEEALRESEEKFRALFENMSAASCIDEVVYKDGKPVDYRVLEVNPSYERISGISRSRAVGALASELYGTADVTYLDVFARVAETGEPVSFEGYFSPVGKYVHFTVSCPAKGRFSTVFTDITARKQAEDALYASEKKYRDLVELTQDLVWAVDMEGRFTYVSPASRRIYGLEPEEMIGRLFTDFMSPEEARRGVAQLAGAAAAGESSVEYECRVLHRNGQEVVLSANTVYLRDSAGKTVATMGTSRDITDRKRAELQRERLAALVEASPDFIGFADPKTTQILYINKHGRKMCGIGDDEDVGKLKISDVHPAWMNRRMTEVVLPTAVRDGVWEGEGAFLHRDGREIPVSMALVARKGADGDVDIFFTVSRDITERKRAEAERERLTMAIEQAAEMVLVTDVRGDIVYVNPAFESVTGYSRADVLGRNPRMLKSGMHDEAFYRALWTAISSGETWHGRMIDRKKDGTLFTQDMSVSPVRNAAGVITSYVSVKRDITRELTLEGQLLQSQKMEGIGRLAGGIAHDFNNLLSVILGYTGLAMDKLREGDPLRDDLLEVSKAGGRAAGLTRQLLAFSRKQVLQPETLDLNRVLTDVEKMLRRIIGEDIDFEKVLTPDLGLVKADPGQIEQVIMNLVINARDAMPEGGKLTIETSNVELDADYSAVHTGVAPGPHVMLAVTDSGVGMDEQTKARIFEPFFTTKEKGKGTGLGLSTVYGIVKQSGGSISFYSEPGTGTTFKVYLPRELSVTTSKVTKPTTVRRRTRGTETILLVEDADALREVARRIIQAAGYTVLAAGSGDEAISTSAQHTGDIHLLLTDVVMPRMGGRVLAQELAKTRPALKVLYMSGYTDDAIVHHGVLDPGTHFISKPFAAADLQRKIREVLDGGH